MLHIPSTASRAFLHRKVRRRIEEERRLGYGAIAQPVFAYMRATTLLDSRRRDRTVLPTVHRTLRGRTLRADPDYDVPATAARFNVLAARRVHACDVSVRF